MKLTIPKAKNLLLVFLFLAALVASRVYHLDKTARFLWDESSDLVNIHQIYVEHKLTLIGPISEDGSKVFGSLTYYMLLPFAIAGNFDPVSTAYGAAFWGIVTGVLILYLTYKVNKKLIYLVAPIIILWYPLVETGRWAWNPNLIPFWVTLSLILFLQKNSLYKFLSGLSIGLAIHHHYLAVFAASGLTIFSLRESVEEKQIKKFLVFVAGLAFAIIPFVIFDLMHPPGLFLSRILYFNSLGEKVSYIYGFWSTLNGTFFYFSQSIIIEVALTISFILLIIFDLKSRSKTLWFAAIFLIQIAGVAFVNGFNTHYILPALPFFVIYLIYPRKDLGRIFAIAALSVILISGLTTFKNQITKVTWESDIAATRFIANTITGSIATNDLKNNNIAVLGSPDPNTYGRRYRDLLLIKDVPLKTKGEYEISDHLFLITESPLDVVRNDPAYEIKYFKTGRLVQSWDVPDSSWKVFLLNRSI